MHRAVPTTRGRFQRDRFTWGAYLLLAYFAYMISALGPLMSFVAAEQSLSYTVRALHLSAFALGMVLAGLMGDHAAQHLGRRAVYWGGGAGMALGALLLCLFRTAPLTIASSFLMGWLGSLLLVMVQATLADRHQEGRAIAFSESNFVAAVASVLAPLLVSQFEGIGWGWRVALLAAAGFWLLVSVCYARAPVPEATRPAPPRADISPANHAIGQRARLPRAFWLYWGVVLASVSMEWCVAFWAGEFLQQQIGFTPVNAAASLTAYFIAFAIGRAVGSSLARRWPVGALLLLAIGVALAGFPLFWLARTPVLSLLGLFLLGLGIANLYPLALSASTGTAPALANAVSARTSLAAGLAILLAPFVLGSAADALGIAQAFAITGVLGCATLAMMLAANAHARRMAMRAAADP
jgi:MFS family permease